MNFSSWFLCVSVLLAIAFETQLRLESGWHFESLAADETHHRYLLLELQRTQECHTRELLTADSTSTLPAQIQEDSSLWDISAPWADTEGWATHSDYHALSFSSPNSGITVGVFVAGGSCDYSLRATFHSGNICPRDCSHHGRCEDGLCDCFGGWVGAACRFPALAIVLNSPLVVEQSSSLVEYRAESDSDVKLQMLSGSDSSVFLLQTSVGYSVPSADYYTQEKSLLGTNVMLKGDQLVIFLAKSSAPPFVLYLEKESNNDMSSSIIVTGAVIGGCLLFVLLVLVLSMMACRKRRSGRVARVMSLIPSEPPTHTREEIAELLDATFPIQRYVEVNDPICTNCVVCLEQFSSGSQVRTLSCGHTYHWKCVERLFQTRLKCGVCNHDFTSLGSTGRSTVRLINEVSQVREETVEIAND